jgi:hypothetical protein
VITINRSDRSRSPEYALWLVMGALAVLLIGSAGWVMATRGRRLA